MINHAISATCTTTSYAVCERWAHADRLGSVVKTTDSAGNVVDKYTYSPYGESGPEGDSGFPFRFTGQKLDAVVGLYNYKARFYDPEVGRFLQTDPIGYADGMNMYAYVGNDPGNRTDPSGLCSRDDADGCASGMDNSMAGGSFLGAIGSGGIFGVRGTASRIGSVKTVFIGGSGIGGSGGGGVFCNAKCQKLAGGFGGGGGLAHAGVSNDFSNFGNVTKNSIGGSPGGGDFSFASSKSILITEFNNPAFDRLGITEIGITDPRFRHIKNRHSFDKGFVAGSGSRVSTFNPLILNDFTTATEFLLALLPGLATTVPEPNPGRPGYILPVTLGSRVGTNGRTGNSTNQVIVVIVPTGEPGVFTIWTAFPE